MIDKIDITMTSVIRPDLMESTLKTITDKVCKDRDGFRLILNVDPVGEKIKPMKVIKVAQKYFDDVVYNIASEPSFPKAVKWVWSQVTAPYTFHWEDDVEILRKIDVDHMIKILKDHQKLSSLRLYKGSTPKNKKIFYTFNCRWIYHKEGFYVAKDWKKQFGLNPILIKSEFVKEAVTRMVDDTNPEKQFRYSQKYMRPLIQKWQYGIYANPGETRLIDGRKGEKWKQEMKLGKPKGQTFLKWENK
jgi:hypothetical protein